MDLTFLVTADTHFGHQVPPDPPGTPPRTLQDARGIERVHLRGIEAMNSIEGQAWPEELGGQVGKVRGVLIAGDLTEDGKPREWARFVAYYGLTGKEGMLHFPVFETIGNHDKHHGWQVRNEVVRRHGSVRYSWDWQDLHLVCLGEAPDDQDLEWLARDLAQTGHEVGIILYFHYPLLGPHSHHQWFGDGPYRAALARTILGYPILGIFHGHYHGSGSYDWNGYDVYNVGSAKHGYHSFAVVHLTDQRMTVASYHYGARRWWWWHDKPIFENRSPSRRWEQRDAGLVGRDGWPTGR